MFRFEESKKFWKTKYKINSFAFQESHSIENRKSTCSHARKQKSVEHPENQHVHIPGIQKLSKKTKTLHVHIRGINKYWKTLKINMFALQESKSIEQTHRKSACSHFRNPTVLRHRKSTCSHSRNPKNVFFVLRKKTTF